MMKFIILLIMSLGLVSCGTQKKVEKKIENEIQSEKVVKRADLIDNTRDYIKNSETLSELQKKSLLSLQDKTVADLKQLSEEINKTKFVLVKIIIKPIVDEREVRILRNKIKKATKQIVSVENKSFEEARKIIDPLKEVRDREYLYNSFIMRHHDFWYY